MIFRQIEEIINGTKTQTRRIQKENEEIGAYWGKDFQSYSEPTFTCVRQNGRIKWQVGRTYAVVPKRGLPQVFYKYVTSHTGEPEIILAHEPTGCGNTILESVRERTDNWRYELECFGYKPLSIQLIGIGYEPLQSITHADALAEGVQSVAEYKALWISINGEQSWYDNPDVWVLEFQKVNHG